MLELIIEWDRIREGKFPEEKLLEIGGITIQKEKLEPFADRITITVELDVPEDAVNAAFELGRLIQQLQVRG